MAKVEYIALTEKSKTICDSDESFNRLLEVSSAFKIEGGKISFNNDKNYIYRVSSNEVPKKDQRYFHVAFESIEEDFDSIEKFSEFLKQIRGVLSMIATTVETIWDDVSLIYSKETYEKIHTVENLMRKLIANFMLFNVGVEWTKEVLPNEIKEAIARSKKTANLNLLQSIDFIQLADFLLKPYSALTNADLIALANKAKTLEDLNALKENLPKSNWNRYFSELVTWEDTLLQKKWSELYELRCKVAHNSAFTKVDYEKTLNLCIELKSKIDEAIGKLVQVSIPEGEIQDVVESVSVSLNTPAAFDVYQTLEDMEEFLIDFLHIEYKYKCSSLPMALHALKKAGVIPGQIYPDALDIINTAAKLRINAIRLTNDEKRALNNRARNVETQIYSKVVNAHQNLTNHDRDKIINLLQGIRKQ